MSWYAYRRPTARIWRYEVVNSSAFVHTRHSRITRRGAERLGARLQRRHQRRARRIAADRAARDKAELQ